MTNSAGKVDFKNLPAIPYLVQVQKYGYHRVEIPYFPDDETGEFETPKTLFIELEPTSLKIALESFYPDFMFPDGVPVIIQGLDGTSTEGIRREAPAFFIPFGPPPLIPLPVAGFPDIFSSDYILPGRYLVTVNHDKASPPVPAADFAGTTYTIGFQGEMYVDVAVGELTVEFMDLTVIPATIRGKLLVADTVAALEMGPSAGGLLSPLYSGPIYKPMEQPGIEFTETIVSDHLPPGFKVLSVDADAQGNFTLTLLPGVYSVKIPAMDGYWGSNYDLINHVDGERFALGWPYNPPDLFTPPFIPIPPFGSLGMLINSRGQYELNLYVRKQLWNLSGEVSADIEDHPALHRIVTNQTDPVLTTDFSDLGKGGEMMLELEGGDALISPLVSKVSGKPGDSRFPSDSAVFSFTAGPGLHSLSGTHPNHSIEHPGTAETVFDIPLPNLEHPGVIVDDYIIPLTKVWGGLPGLPDTLKAEYTGTVDLRLEFYGINQADDRVLVTSFTKPDIFTFPGHGDKQFAVGVEPFKMIGGSYDVWKKYAGKWYKKSVSVTDGQGTEVVEVDIVEGPGLGTPPPALTYTLKVEAVSDADPKHLIPGLMVKFDDTHTFTTATTPPFIETGHDGDYIPDSVSPVTKWIPALGSGSTIASYDIKMDIEAEPAKIDVTLRMKRGMAVKGTVEAKFDPGDEDETPKPVKMVRVIIRNRYGNVLAGAVTDEMGKFELSPALTNAQTIFLEVSTPGFYPFRKRIMPNNLGVDGTPVDVEETITLKPLPGPTDISGTFDRYGSFLPGVSKSTSGGILTPDEDLTTTFELRAKEQELTYSLVPYDSPDGTAGTEEEITVADPVKQIWLVDTRGFPKNPFSDKPVALELPKLTEPFFNLEMGLFLNAAVQRTFMEPVEPGVFPYQWYRRFSALRDGETGVDVAMGELSLATLPPGDFKPLIVAVSQRGAYSFKKYELTGSDTFKNLYGLKLPPWAASVADVLGTATAVKEAGSGINWDNFIPESYLSPFPDITADIELVDGHFLKYTYELGMNLQEGMELPGTGIGAVIPGFAGLDVNGMLTLEINGKSRTSSGFNAGEISLGGEIVATSKALDITDYIPQALPKRIRKKAAEFIKANVEASVVAGGSAELKTTELAIGGMPLERNIKATTSAGVSVPISIDITPVVQTIPTVGPIVSALKKTRFNPTFKANIDDAIGTTVSRTFTTQYPHIIKAGSGGSVEVIDPRDPTEHTARRHFLGGKMEPFSKDYKLERALCLRFGVGLEVETFGGRAGASGSLTLQGNECKLPTSVGGKTQPAMKITLNQFGDWPPITRIQGKLTGEIEAYLDAWVTRFSKSWDFDLIEIDIPFNSEASFDLSPINISETIYGLSTAAAAEYLGEPPTLVQDLFLPGQVSVSGTGDAVILFTDVDSSTGEMLLQFAHRTGTHEWSAIGELARTGGVVAANILSLPGGGWLAVWTQIAPGNSTSLTPPTTLMYSTSSDGISWTTATLAGRDAVASDIRLVPLAGDDVGLLFLETDRGPNTIMFSLNGVVFDGSAWGSVMELHPPAIIRDWDAEGPGATGTGEIQIAVVTDGEKLRVISWDGTTVSPATELVSTDVVAPVELGCGPDDFFTLAYSLNGGGIGFFTLSTGGDWVDRGIVFEGALPNSLTVLDMFDGSEYAYLISWTDGGSGNVFYGYVDAVGSVLAGPANLTQNIHGIYRGIQSTQRGSSHDASLFALFDNGETTEVRTFDVSRISGSINNDRDEDTLDDLAEMRIVDADTSDALDTVDKVLPGADFDEDGFSNKVELDAGTDPTDPGSFPGQSISLSTEVAECFEFGTVPGQVAVIRSGDGSAELKVKYSISGSATNGTDYSALSGEVTLAPGIYVHMLNIYPEGDVLAEGDETVILTLIEDVAYDLDAQAESTVTIQDLPMDKWRLAHFTETELLDDSITGDASDADRNSLILLMEYAFGITPNSQSNENIPYAVVLVNSTTSLPHAGIIYLRPNDAIELEYSIEVTDDLGNWLAGPDQIEIVSVTDNGDGTETVVARDLTPIGDTGRFLRLNVIRNSE